MHETEKERRISERSRLSDSVEFQFKDPRHFGGSLSCDVSQSGIRIHLNEFVALHTELNLRVKLKKDQFVDCRGEVVWVSQQPYSDRYQAGLKFIDDEALVEAKPKILEYLENLNGLAGEERESQKGEG